MEAVTSPNQSRSCGQIGALEARKQQRVRPTSPNPLICMVAQHHLNGCAQAA